MTELFTVPKLKADYTFQLIKLGEDGQKKKTHIQMVKSLLA
jgi:hypothetical protein